MASFFRSVARCLQVVGYFIVMGTELLVKRPPTRQGRAEWLHRFCAMAIHGLGVEVEMIGKFPERGAVISNHLSYVDIVLFAALRPCVFVSKAEIANWPVIGWMTTMSGTVYVQRGHGGSALKASSGMQAAADAGLPVVFFPEGTTTNGEAMLKFHSGVLAQAMGAGQPMTAAYIKYELGDGNDPAMKASEVICWGDDPMWPHVFRFLGLRNVKATVLFAEAPIKFSSEVIHRKLAAIEAREAVSVLEAQTVDKSEVGVFS